VSGRVDPRKARAFWAILMRLRDLHLGGVIDQETESDLKAGLKTASAMTAIARLIGLERGGFRTGDLESGDWTSLLQVTARWAHFRSFEYYETIRAEERELVRSAFYELPRQAKGELYPWLSRRDTRRDTGPDFDALLVELTNAAAGAAVDNVLALFEQPQGLQILWGEKGASAPAKAVVFSQESPLYKDETQTLRLIDAASRASESAIIHGNFLTLFRQLAYGATEGGSFSREECVAIIGKAPVIKAIWGAAVAQPLNPRVAGSLREQRSAIAPKFTAEENLPPPGWWRELEEFGFFKS